MTLLALWFVLPPLFAHAEGQKSDEMRAANVLVYQDQCQELETDLRNGLIGEPEYQKEKQELERRLLADTETAKRASSCFTGNVARDQESGVRRRRRDPDRRDCFLRGPGKSKGAQSGDCAEHAACGRSSSRRNDAAAN